VTRTHLVTGAAGQDGVLLARALVARGDRVVGLVRPGSAGPRAMAPYLDGVDLVEVDVRDTDGIAAVVERERPDVLHNLAAASSVAASWEDPTTSDDVNHRAVVGLLDVVRRRRTAGHEVRLVHASSSEVFGPIDGGTVDEGTPLNPVSPYAEAKAAAQRAVAAAREVEGMPVTSLVLFGHTSPLNPPHFVLRTIARQAAETGLGRRTGVALRDPSVVRDWGSARDVARAFVAAADGPSGDYVVATGEVHRLSEVVAWALAGAGGAGAVAASGEAPRPHDFDGGRGDTRRIREALGWRPLVRLRREIEAMVDVDRRRLTSGVEEDATYLDAGYLGAAYLA
jgi:GDPmannose 4,6-dehydratase